MTETIDKALAHDATHLAFEAAMRTLGPEHVDTTPTGAIETMMEPVAPEAPWWTKLEGLPSMMKALAEARENVTWFTENARDATIAYQNTREYAEYAQAAKALNESKTILESITALAKEEALKDFTKNGEKAVYAGVSVKMFTKIDYDPKAMRDWAKVNMTSLLTLDTRATELAAKAGILDDAPVTVSKEARAIIASDLTGYLSPPLTTE
jgi:hypothetical protein